MRNRFFSIISPVSNCLSYVKNSRIPSVMLGATIVALGEILDFICTQKSTNDAIDWDYFNDTPSRIVAVVLTSLALGFNLDYVIRTIRADMATTNDNVQIKISAKKIFFGCTTYCSLMSFSNKALNLPINSSNAGYIVGSSLLQGSLAGTIMSGTGYFLQRLNYSIRPITSTHFKYISAGILVATLQQFLNFLCQEMIENNSVDFNNLISKERIIAWNILVMLTQGIAYGISAINLKTHSQTTHVNADSLRNFRNFSLIALPIFSTLSIFTISALKIPINSANCPYILMDSVLQGIPAGWVTSANMVVVIKLKVFPEERLDSPLLTVNRRDPNNLLSSLSLLSSIQLNSSSVSDEIEHANRPFP